MSNDAGSKIIDVEIAELSAAGDGVASAGRLRIAVPFTIPGERVRVRLDPGRNGRVFPALLEACMTFGFNFY